MAAVIVVQTVSNETESDLGRPYFVYANPDGMKSVGRFSLGLTVGATTLLRFQVNVPTPRSSFAGSEESASRRSGPDTVAQPYQ